MKSSFYISFALAFFQLNGRVSHAQDSFPQNLPLTSKAISQEMTPPAENCDNCTDSSTYPLHKPVDLFFFKKSACSEVLSGHPPILSSSEIAALNPVHQEWIPVCSLYQLNESRVDQSHSSTAKILQEVISNQMSNDGCAAPRSQIRDGGGYKSPSQASEEVVPMTSAQLDNYMSQVHAAEKQVSQYCCGSGPQQNQKSCLDYFAAIKLSICKPVNDPKKPDPCVEDTTQFQENDDGTGTLSLGPFMHNDLPNDNLFVMFHELGHACSSAQRLTQPNPNADLKKINQASPFDEHGNVTADCSLDGSWVNVYTPMFARLGAGPDSQECLFKDARGNQFQK